MKKKATNKKASKRDKLSVSATQARSKGRSCAVCTHPRRAEFDKALVLETMSAAEVAREVGCNRTSVGRHQKNHLIATARPESKASEVREVSKPGEIDIFSEVKALYTKMQKHLELAESEANWKAIRAFHNEARQDLELLAKLVGKIESTPVYNLIVSPVWVQMRCVILRSLEPFPEARIAVSQALIEADTAGTLPGMEGR